MKILFFLVFLFSYCASSPSGYLQIYSGKKLLKKNISILKCEKNIEIKQIDKKIFTIHNYRPCVLGQSFEFIKTDERSFHNYYTREGCDIHFKPGDHLMVLRHYSIRSNGYFRYTPWQTVTFTTKPGRVYMLYNKNYDKINSYLYGIKDITSTQK